jgi:cathepsin A (carboxypeptidase C)
MKVILPGVPDTAPYEYFSGFLDAGMPPSSRGKMYFHYICAMAPNWREMPMSLWYNGGPGAPSTFGLFQEFGPYLLNQKSLTTAQYKTTGIPTPVFNPWTWANATSLCEIDSPAPMGASFCTEGNGTAGSVGGPSGDAYSCGPWTDHTTAAANHLAHISFFKDAFPEFETNQQPVSIIGESYGGVYVPLFVNAWLDDPIKGPNGKLINFKGFAVGDGFPACIPTPGKNVDWCVDLNNVQFFRYPNALPGPYWDVEFFHGHGQMSEALYNTIKDVCSDDELKGITMPLSPACSKLITQQMADEIGFFFAYDLYDACLEDVPPPRLRRMIAGNTKKQRVVHDSSPVLPNSGNGDSGLGAPCLGSSMDIYFDLNATKDALGIPRNNNFIVLDNGIGMNYTTDAGFVGYVYEKANKAGKRILVYEGDSDACGLETAPIEDVWVPFFGNGTGAWTPMGRLNDETAKPLGLTMTQSWRPFGVVPAGRKVQAGFVMEWDGGKVSFVSIRGAGHLMPLYRPAAAFTMMQAFQKGESVPPSFYPYRKAAGLDSLPNSYATVV